MDKTIRSIAIRLAVMIFFIMSLVGWFFGHSPATCCNRAFIGAIVTYLAACWAARAVVKIIVNEMIENKVSKLNKLNKKHNRSQEFS